MKKIAISTIIVGAIVFVLGAFDPFHMFDYRREQPKEIALMTLGVVIGLSGLGILAVDTRNQK